MKKIQSKNIVLIKALFVMLLWGSLFPMVKLGFNVYSVKTTGDILLFAGIRFLICGLAISFYSLFTEKEQFENAKSSFVPVLLSGVFAIILHYSFTYIGLNLTNSSKTAILKQTGVLFYVCFSALFFKDDKLTSKKLIGVLLGFFGIVAINSDKNGVSFEIGDAFIIAASFCTVFANVISKKVFANVSPITSTGVSQLFGGIVLVIIGVLLGGKVYFNHSWWIMGYICLASIFSYCIWYGTVKNAELSKLFIIKFAEPVFSALFGAVILRDNIMRLEYLIAFILIAIGVTISHSGKQKKSS